MLVVSTVNKSRRSHLLVEFRYVPKKIRYPILIFVKEFHLVLPALTAGLRLILYRANLLIFLCLVLDRCLHCFPKFLEYGHESSKFQIFLDGKLIADLT